MTSRRRTRVSPVRKQKNFIGGMVDLSSRMYLRFALINVIASLPDLHLRLLMND